MNLAKQSIQTIDHWGCLIVFPIKGKVDPPSLWHELYPRSEMRWDWDVSGDDRVVNLWHMMKGLSTSGKVVYSKWYQNRATFFSKSCFESLLRQIHIKYKVTKNLYPEAQTIFRLLNEDSPLSTKEIKLSTQLKGKMFESLYNRSLQQLFQRGLIVSYGEKDDGAFPSAMIGSTELLFEEIYRKAMDYKSAKNTPPIQDYFNKSPSLSRQLDRIEKSLNK